MDLVKMLDEKLKTVQPKKSGEIEAPNKEFYPSFSIDSKSLPEIKDWEVGEEYTVVMKISQRSFDSYGTDKGEDYRASFDIKEIGVLGEEEEKETETNDPDEDEMMSKHDLKKKYGS